MGVISFGGAPGIGALDRRYRGGTSCIAIGTSLVNQGHGTVLSGGTIAQLFSSGRSWMTALEIFSYGAIQFPIWPDPSVYLGWEPVNAAGTTRGFFGANMGVSGQYAQQIDDRIFGTETVTKTISDYPFSDAFLDEGTNDVAGSTAAAILAVRIASIEKLLRICERIFVLPIRIRSTASWTAEMSQRAAHCNAMLRDWCLKNGRLFWLDWNRPLVLGTAAAGGPRAGYLDDGIHDAPMGGMAIGWWMWHGQIWTGTEFVDDWPGLKTMFGLTPGSAIDSQLNVYHATQNPRGNLHPNGKMLNLGSAGTVNNGITGTAPTSVYIQRSVASGSTTGVASLEDRKDGRSGQAVVTFTPGGSADESFYVRTAPSTVDVSGLANQWIRSAVDVDVSGYAGFTELSLTNQPTAEDITVIANKPYKMTDVSPNLPLAAFPWKGRLRTPYYKLGAAPTTLSQRATIGIRGSVAGAPVVKVSNFETVVVDDPTTVLTG